MSRFNDSSQLENSINSGFSGAPMSEGSRNGGLKAPPQGTGGVNKFGNQGTPLKSSGQSNKNLLNGSPSKDLSAMQSENSRYQGRGKSLKNDDVPEVSEDDENSQKQPGGPTYRDMEEEDENSPVPINGYGGATPKNQPTPKKMAVEIPKLPIGQNAPNGYAEMIKSEEINDQSMESYQFDSKGSDEYYPEIVPSPAAKPAATSGGLQRTQTNAVTRPVAAGVSPSGLSDKKLAQKAEKTKQKLAQAQLDKYEREKKEQDKQIRLQNKPQGFQYSSVDSQNEAKLYNLAFDQKNRVDKIKFNEKEMEMKPKNDAMEFQVPRSAMEVDNHVFDYYSKNTHIRQIDVDEDPRSENPQLNKQNTLQRMATGLRDECVVKDVKNIHISSDHQRAYVWSLTYIKQAGSLVESVDQKRSLWLQVYSLASSWASTSTLTTEQIQKMQSLQQLRLEVQRLEYEFENLSQVVIPENNQKQTRSMIHQNQGIQSLVEKARKDALRREQVLKTKKAKLQQYETQFYEEMSYFQSNPVPDIDQESRHYHLVNGYRSVHSSLGADNSNIQENGDGLIQQPQYADFSILIGEFEFPKAEYLYDPIQSYYKQFVTSEQAFYFFKYEDEIEQLSQNQPSPNRNGGTSVASDIKTNPESENSYSYVADGATRVLRPVFYQLSAYQNKCERVLINGKAVRLPIDSDSNQFAIVRPLDPERSRESSFLDNFMVSIMKEVHLKFEEPLLHQIANRDAGRRRSTKRGPPLQQRLIETVVEIFIANQNTPTLGANVNLREIPPEFDPKNISAFHKNEDTEDEEKKPVNMDFNFCCWYIIDKNNHNLNFSILLNTLQINMRTPYELDPISASPEEIKKRIVVAKNCQFQPGGQESLFLKEYEITQDMPIYSIELKKPINFSKLSSFKKTAKDARHIWQRELGNQDETNFELGNMILSQNSPSLPSSQLQNLIESQDSISQNLDVNIERLYLIIRHKTNDINFEVLYPIIPDYFWSSTDGKQLRQEIDQKLLLNFKQYLQKEPNYQSFKDSGINTNLYTNLVQNVRAGQIKQFSRNLLTADQSPEVQEFASEKISQCAFHHQIFLETETRSYEKFTEKQKNQVSAYGMTNFPGIKDLFSTLIIDNQAVYGKKVQKNLPGKVQIKAPLVSCKQQSLIPKVSQKQAILSTISKVFVPIKESTSIKQKFQLEKLIISEDQQTFVHIIKYKKKYAVRKNEIGEIIRFYYRGKYMQFEEEFEFFDFQITIGHLNLAKNQHMIHLNEERDPMRKSQQLLQQFCMFDGQEMPLQNPYTPYQSLVMLTDFDQVEEDESKFKSHYSTMSAFLQRQATAGESILNNAPKLKIFQISLKKEQKMHESKVIDELTWFKNPPVELTFVEFQRNPELRRSFYTEYMLQHNMMTEVQWSRQDDSKYPLSDFLNEMCKVKFWISDDLSQKNQTFKIKTVDIFAEINSVFPKYIPSTRCILDSSSPPEPYSWDILRNLFIDKFCLTTIKQQRCNPRNVVLALVPRRPNDLSQICPPGSPAIRQNQILYFVGTLSGTYDQFINLQVIRQSFDSLMADEERGKKPLKPVKSVFETLNYVDFAKEFVDANSRIAKSNPMYGRNFPKMYQNAGVMAFDTNFGDSFGSEVEIFAAKTWVPYNAIKIYEYDYTLMSITELYEIAIEAEKLDEIKGIQLARISEEDLTYAVLVDWCSFKSVYILSFTKVANRKSILSGYQTFKVTTSLVGKYDIMCPNLYESNFINGINSHFIVNQQMKMTPNYKSVKGNQKLYRDGFSLFVDQVRFDFDYKYFSNTPQRENIKYRWQNVTNVFEYEHNVTKKIKKNINPENTIDDEFYRCIIIKVKIRDEILANNVYTENQKLKLLNYFCKTIQGHSNIEYSRLFNQVSSNVSITDSEAVRLMQPRSELFGSSLLSFLSLDQDIAEQCISILQENQEVVYSSQLQDNMLSIKPDQLIYNFLPQISQSAMSYHKTQMSFYMQSMRNFEMDMNLMSPITWAFYNKAYNTGKVYVQFLKEFSKICGDKNVIRDHAPIFYGAVNKLISYGVINLEEFLNPDGVGEDFGCELFQQQLTNNFLPQFAPSDQVFTNDYRRSLESLERNLSQAFFIDDIHRPQNQEEDAKIEIKEVQYGIINLDWVDILNVFDQQPISRLIQSHKKATKNKVPWDYKKELKLQKSKRKSIIQHVSESRSLDIFTFESIKILIDHNWDIIGYDFFKTQFWIFMAFFILPFSVDLIHLDYAIENNNIKLIHLIMSFMALFTQFLFFLNEIIQMSIKGTSILDYFKDFWNQNDIMCFPTYMALQLVLWINAGKKEAEIDVKMEIGIKVLYMIVVVQAFIKFLFLIRIYPSIGFTIRMLGKVMCDLYQFFIFTIMYNALFATLFGILSPELGGEYDDINPGLKWMLFVFRNALHDFQIESGGFMISFEEGTDPKVIDHFRFTMYLTWLIWLGNVVLMTILLLNFVIAVINQTYEQVMGDVGAHIYRQKAELVVEAQQILMWLGYYRSGSSQHSVVIRKKKFSDDVAERLDKEKWSGVTQTLKTYLDFCVIAKIQNVEDQNEMMKRRQEARMSQMDKSLREISRKMDALAQRPREIKPVGPFETPDQEFEASGITFRASMNNVSH